MKNIDIDSVKNEVKYDDLINAQDVDKIRSFKYNGKDDSILYHKVLSPLAQWIVDNKVPPTLAPNVITLIGLACVLIPHWLIEWTTSGEAGTKDENGEFSIDPAPNRFLIFLFAIGLFAYNTLDNMDGK
jgi:ethanolaminephosphotransferase